MKQFSLLALLSFILVSCAAQTPAATPSLTVTSAPSTAAPTEIPNVPMIEVGHVKVPDPKVSNPAFFDITNPQSLLYDLKMAGIQIDQQAVISNLKYVKINNTDNVVVYFDFQPSDEKYDFMNGPLPLLVYDSQVKMWRMLGYKDFPQNNISMGSDINVWTGQFDLPEYQNIFLRMYNVGVPGEGLDPHVDFMKELKNAPLSLTPEQIITYYSWTNTDKLVQYLTNKNIPVRLQHLVDFGIIDDIPQQFRNLSNNDLKTYLDLHIKTILERYPQATEVSVVNEAFWEGGMPGNNFLYSRLGKDYVTQAFISARNYAPNAKLYLNDNLSNGHDTNHVLKGSFDAIFDFIKKQKSAGVPIDGFGLESHLLAKDFLTDGQADDNKIVQFENENITVMKKFAEIKTPVYITELDINDKDLPANMTPQDKQLLAAKIYKAIFEACLQSGNCASVTTWGFTDKASWLNDQNGVPDLPFDSVYNPTLSYFAVLQTLMADSQ